MSGNGTPGLWESIKLADIAEVRLGRQRSPKRATGPNMRPYMRAANVTWKGIDISDVKEMDFTPVEYETYRLRDGDILLGEASGSPDEVGKPAVWHNEVPGSCFQNTLIRVRPHDDALVPFLHLHFLRDAVTGRFAKASRGVGIHHLGAAAISDWEVVIPPLGEQRRIVEIIDLEFSKLDDAVANLERVRANLKRYRASVLKAAVEGRLVPTEAELARREGRSYEPASELLQRILKERRRRWDDSGRKGKYVEPVEPDTTGLPELPEGWVWASVEQLSCGDRKCAYGVLVPGDDVEGGVPLVRVGDIHDGTVETDGLKHISRQVADRFAKTYLVGGEVLISLVGTIGRTAVVPPSLAGANLARAVGMIPTTDFVSARWVELWFRNPEKQRQMISLSHEVARKTFGLAPV